MRLRNVKNAHEILESSPYFIKEPINYVQKWAHLFNNSHPIHLEIGTGKGNFLIQMAQTYPHLNFIGVEKYESVLVRAIEKSANYNLPNLKFLCIDAKMIANYFNHEITTLYLNFSDPWPKKRHASRRLTSPLFLQSYDQIFQNDCHIIQKTDNIQLFAYSLESLSQNGYYFKQVSLDLAHAQILNIPTEYEEKFTNLGYKINYLEAIKKKSN